ncbi:protein SHORT HYPOCOTYL IN WHITE LIGHT 1 [Impatiens glandulifera]|uniref:protein SHORT HYPOCOTYL IN WHITE LIGHT 1 n=1 Tax=Impatiens glandulifera TaxID=253017 RepID=UPI001FB17902|nr:protein SHORT HYPOCOTYL IN WHITE LIGHT 1 [Impatiens glandulifera]
MRAAMADAATSLSSFISLSRRQSPSPLSFSPRLSFHLQSLHQRPRRFSELRLCQAKLRSSTDDVPDEIQKLFFHDDDDLIEGESDSEDDDDETESSMDLLFRFIQSMFRKLSKRAKKASRSVLPAAISPQLVSFAVDGLLLLASFSILKAFLEVVCTLGGTVFLVILLLRVIWSGLAYFKSEGNNFNNGSSYGRPQPIT